MLVEHILYLGFYTYMLIQNILLKIEELIKRNDIDLYFTCRVRCNLVFKFQ